MQQKYAYHFLGAEYFDQAIEILICAMDIHLEVFNDLISNFHWLGDIRTTFYGYE